MPSRKATLWALVGAFILGAVASGVALGRGPSSSELRSARDSVATLSGVATQQTSEIQGLKERLSADSASRAAEDSASNARIAASERVAAAASRRARNATERLEGMISDTAAAVLDEVTAAHAEQVQALEDDKTELIAQLLRANAENVDLRLLVGRLEARDTTRVETIEAQARVIALLEEEAKPGWRIPGLGLKIPTIIKDAAIVAGGYCLGRFVSGESCP